MYFHWASQTLLKNSRCTQPYGACLCYKVCVQVQGAANCTHGVRQCMKCAVFVCLCVCVCRRGTMQPRRHGVPLRSCPRCSLRRPGARPILGGCTASAASRFLRAALRSSRSRSSSCPAGAGGLIHWASTLSPLREGRPTPKYNWVRWRTSATKGTRWRRMSALLRRGGGNTWEQSLQVKELQGCKMTHHQMVPQGRSRLVGVVLVGRIR